MNYRFFIILTSTNSKKRLYKPYKILNSYIIILLSSSVVKVTTFIKKMYKSDIVNTINLQSLCVCNYLYNIEQFVFVTLRSTI